MKPTMNSLTVYRQWQSYLDSDHPKLDPKIKRMALLGFAHVTAKMGGKNSDNGQRLFVGNQAIADALECTRDTVAAYKAEAFRIGWFEYTGGAVGRAKVFRINIPDRKPYPFERQARKANTGNLRQYNARPRVNEPESDAKPLRPATGAPREHNGQWPVDCLMCCWYVDRRHPDMDAVTDTHP